MPPPNTTTCRLLDSIADIVAAVLLNRRGLHPLAFILAAGLNLLLMLVPLPRSDPNVSSI